MKINHSSLFKHPFFINRPNDFYRQIQNELLNNKPNIPSKNHIEIPTPNDIKHLEKTINSTSHLIKNAHIEKEQLNTLSSDLSKLLRSNRDEESINFSEIKPKIISDTAKNQNLIEMKENEGNRLNLEKFSKINQLVDSWELNHVKNGHNGHILKMDI